MNDRKPKEPPGPKGHLVRAPGRLPDKLHFHLPDSFDPLQVPFYGVE